MVVLWLWIAFNRSMAGAALVICAVLMFGLAAGRVLNYVLDGMPHWLLVIYATLGVIPEGDGDRTLPGSPFNKGGLRSIMSGLSAMSFLCAG
jgi:hypothetical protein